MPERPCIVPGCPGTTRRSRCAKHEREANLAHLTTLPHSNVYSTWRWKAIRERVRRRDGYRCAIIENGLRCPVVGRSLPVHHLVPIADRGDPFDPANLRTVCARHHAMLEQKARIGAA